LNILIILFVFLFGGHAARKRMSYIRHAHNWQYDDGLYSGLNELRYHLDDHACHLTHWCLERYLVNPHHTDNSDLEIAFKSMGLSDYELDGFITI
jgi:hypothetical protein